MAATRSESPEQFSCVVSYATHVYNLREKSASVFSTSCCHGYVRCDLDLCDGFLASSGGRVSPETAWPSPCWSGVAENSVGNKCPHLYSYNKLKYEGEQHFKVCFIIFYYNIFSIDNTFLSIKNTKTYKMGSDSAFSRLARDFTIAF